MAQHIQAADPIVDYFAFLISDGKDRRNFKISPPDFFSPLAKCAFIEKWANWCTSFLEALFGPDDESYFAFLEKVQEVGLDSLWANVVDRLIEILGAKRSDILANPLDEFNISEKTNFTSIKAVNSPHLDSLILEGKEFAQRANAFDFEYGHLIWENPLVYKENIPIGKSDLGKDWIVKCNLFLKRHFGKGSCYYRTFEEKSRIDSLCLYHFGAGIRSLEEHCRELTEPTWAKRAEPLISQGEAIGSKKPIGGYLMEGKPRLDLWYIKREELTKSERESFNQWKSNYKDFIKQARTAATDFYCTFDGDLQEEYRNVICVDQVIEVLKDVKRDSLWDKVIRFVQSKKTPGIKKEEDGKSGGLDSSENPKDPPLIENEPEKSRNGFYRKGPIWFITYQGREISLQDMNGLRYIHMLLEKPWEELSCLDMYKALPSVEAYDARKAKTPLSSEVFTDYEPSTGAKKSKDEIIEESLRELKCELAKAEKEGDTVLAAQLKKELGQALNAFTKKGNILESEKTNKSNAIRNSINRVMKTLKKELKELESHFFDSINIGKTCSYRPKSYPDWILR